MSEMNPDTLTPADGVLDNFFADSIVPQLFIKSDLSLRRFTPPAGNHFSLTPGDIGINIMKVKEKIGYRHLVEKIRGVLITERCLSKEVKTSDGRVFHLNIQPFFGNQDQRLEGVIITFLDLPDQVPRKKTLD